MELVNKGISFTCHSHEP